MMTNIDHSYPTPARFPTQVLRALRKERWAFVLTFAALLGCGVFIVRRLPPIYGSESTLLIEYPRTLEQLTTLEQPETNPLSPQENYNSLLSNQAALIGSRPNFEKALTRLNLPAEKAPYSNLSVTEVPGTDLLKITYQSASAPLAAQIVEAVVDVYIEETRNLNQGKSAATQKFLDQQLPELRQKFLTAQNRLEAFQTRHRLLGTTIEGDTVTRALYEYQDQVTTLQGELASTTEKINHLKAQLPNNLRTAINAAGLSQETGYQEIQKQLLETETQLADLKSRVTPEHPQYISLSEKRNYLNTLLRQRSFAILGTQARAFSAPLDPLRQRLVEQWFMLEIDRAAQAARLGQLSQQLQQLQQRAAQLPQLMKQQAQLQLAVDVTRRDYTAFKEQYTNSQLAAGPNISNVRIVEPARVNLSPVAPNHQLHYAIALVVSGAAATGVVWWRRSRNNRLDGIAELRQILPLATLATVPWSGNGRLGQEKAEGRSLSNSFRLLQAHIRMLPQEVRVVAVCSWASQEGRSSVAANLALLEAQAGQRVLLIDGDSVAPSQAEFWGLNHSKTAPSAQFNGRVPGAALLHKVFPNFDVLPYGNSSISIFYKEWLVFLQQARQRYDLIVFDCPPAAQGADATVLASLSDGVLWVACPERLGRQGAEAAAENLRSWNSRLLGQVVIGVGGSKPPTHSDAPTSGLPSPAPKTDYPGLPELA